MNYKIVKNKNKYALMVAGEKDNKSEDYVSICPYQTPMLVPVQAKLSIQQGSVIQRWQCGSDCPFFEVVTEEENEISVALHCSPNTILIKGKLEEVKESKLDIVK